MQISTAAKRYATALFASAKDAKAQAALTPQIQALAGAITEDLAASLAAPLSRNQRAQLAGGLAKGLKAHQLLANLLGLLADNNRLSLLPQIAAAYVQQANAEQGILSAEVQSAEPLTEAQQKALAAQLKAVTKAKDVTLTATLRPQLIGGFRVFFGGQVWDESLRGHLEGLKQRLRDTLSTHQKPSF